MGKTKKLRNTAKLRHVPFNEQLSSMVRVKGRVKSKPEDASVQNNIQVQFLLTLHSHNIVNVSGSG